MLQTVAIVLDMDFIWEKAVSSNAVVGLKNEMKVRTQRLKLEVALNELTELFAVFVAHMDEFDAASVRADIADHSSETDLAETGADFELDGVTDTEFPRGLQISASQADGSYPGKACWRALDMG